MGITDDIKDPVFKAGQLADAKDLGDKGFIIGDAYTPDWIPPFQQQVHGVLIVAGDCQASVDTLLHKAIRILKLAPSRDSSTICHEVVRLHGTARPEEHSGHEQYVIQLDVQL